jgi:phage gpG-like protein
MSNGEKKLVVVDTQRLTQEGFTNSGQTQFVKTVEDFSEELLARTTRLADLDKHIDKDREATHEHVRTATGRLAGPLTRKGRSNWAIAGQVLEYACAGAVGAGASNLDSKLGIVTFGLGLFVGTVLIVSRIMRERDGA